MDNKVQIKISDILRMLKEGYTRKDLADHYGITQAAMKKVFTHPELKGRRTMPKVEDPFILIDDTVSQDEVEVPTEVQQEIENAEAEAGHQEMVEALTEEEGENDPWSNI